MLQAYNDQKDILIITDRCINVEVYDIISDVVGYINTCFCMNTNVICIDDMDVIKMIDIDDLVISIGGCTIHKEAIENVGAYYSELDINDLGLLPYMIPEYNNAKT
jgi:hypothetical protein